MLPNATVVLPWTKKRVLTLFRWEEERKDDGTKWKFLEHKGPVFAPPYEPLPDNVHFYYDGKAMKLTEETEEVMTFYGRMIDHDYTTMDVFNNNFFKVSHTEKFS